MAISPSDTGKMATEYEEKFNASLGVAVEFAKATNSFCLRFVVRNFVPTITLPNDLNGFPFQAKA